MPSDSNEVTTNGNFTKLSVDDEGFQKVLTSSERRVLKKKHNDVKRFTLSDCNSLENSILSRLKKRGLDLTNDPEYSSVESSTIDADELSAMISDIEEAIVGVLFDAQKPDQNLTIAELDNRIRTAKNNLSQMKTKKKGTFSKDELENATQETEVYIAYLQQQIALTREYQKLKNAQNSLTKLKSSLKEALNVKTRLRTTVAKNEKKTTTSNSETKLFGTTKRTVDYIYEFIKEMKDRHGETFEANDLTSQDHKMADGTKFLPPYTFLQKVKQKFDVFIDKSGTKPLLLSVYGCTNDVKNCVEYLASLDLSTENKLNLTFSKYRPLLELEETYNVLLNYNSGTVEVLGSPEDVKTFLEYVETNVADTHLRDSLRDKEGSNKVSESTDSTSDNDKMYDYYVLRALSGKFRSNVRELETEYGVGIKFDLTPRNGYAKVSFVPLLDNTVDKCMDKFTSYVEEYAHKDLGKLTNEELAFLADNDVLKKRYRSQYTTLVKVGDKVFVVGLKKYLNFGFNRAQQLLESRKVAPQKIKLTSSQYHLLLPHLQSLQDQKGVYVSTSQLNGPRESKGEKESKTEESKEKGIKEKEILLNIYGNTAQQKECISVINEMLSSFVSSEVYISGAEYNVLMEEKGKLTELESKYQSKMTLTKNTLSISGPKTQVDTLLENLNEIFSKVIYLNLNEHTSTVSAKNESTVYAVLTVPQKSLGKIIGKGGSTLKQLLMQSSLNNIIITKANVNGPTKLEGQTGREKEKKNKQKEKEVDALLLIGNSLGVHFALSLVKQVVESDEELAPTKGENRSLYDEYTSKHSIMRRTTANHVTHASTKAKPDEKLDINDLMNFPSL
ncbi:uncharacterized protein TOT_010000819 [Theileria orientalis strain Shintoku]|uniref:K Homology domain-containing protein n=1 Tax=Theileria orientalis strain Shintoku TaxID=869250 RepID=J4CCG7_THEOR|nr:uncharacterized protein TOT_010000819 [Theileria orientalis strain Shintoku]PVC54835.1 hypothetical protein MACL_00003557 [Theileria orientalis]BAM39362.1 uncharacterized protein TOT_010000819 [Theileria orientalis strain Shintoku]|eukprot:XP_009689663.1 uncharacterized protein TOT_010000819 [Theileria orientalis strain Shintoku]